jgi:hypothetical protein
MKIKSIQIYFWICVFVLSLVFATGDVEAMQIALTEVALNEETKDVVSFYEVMAELQKTEKTILDLDDAQEAKLVEIADGKSLAKYLAQNTLEFAKGYKYERSVEIWKEENFEAGSDGRSENLTTNESNVTNWLQLIPNPTSGQVDIRWNPSSGDGFLEIFDLSGRILLQKNVTMNEGFQTYTSTNNVKGIFIVRLKSTIGTVTSKLIVE